MGVKRKLKDTCGSKVRGICITYDGAVPEWSTIEDVDCVVVEETIEDLYEAVSELKEITNLGDISDDCIDYEEEVCKEVTSKEVLLKHKELIKKLLEVTGITDSEVTESTETKAPVDVSNLDTKCLADACG